MELVAGTNLSGFSGDNGPATLAKINANVPWVDSVGNVYIPDNSYSRIRKVDSGGIITTVIESGDFSNPYSIVGDAAGTALYFSDLSYVYKYEFVSNNLTVVNDEVSGAYGLWLTTSGSLFIAEYYNQRIRKVITSSGTITTVAGSGSDCNFSGDNGPATSAQLCDPQGVYMDTVGKLFIADTDNCLIRVVDTNNIITTFAGTFRVDFNGDNLPATSANLKYPTDVKGDSAGNIYVTDIYNCMVRVIDNTGIISVLFGTPDRCSSGIISTVPVGRFSPIGSVRGMWIDSTATVYFSTQNVIRRGVLVALPPAPPDRFPNLFLKQIAGTGTEGNSAGNGPATLSQIWSYLPWVDSSGIVYIPYSSSDAFGGTQRIRKIDLAGIITTFGGTGSGSTAGTGGPINSVSFYLPYSIVGDTAATVLYISDQWYVWKYLFSTNIVTVFAHIPNAAGGFSGDNGPATNGQLNSPRGLWLTTSGSLYIADIGNHRIRKVFISSGIMSTVAGSGGIPGYSYGSFTGDNAPAPSAKLNFPQGVYVDTNGKLFIADRGNLRIRVVDTNNIITTFAGTGTFSFNGDYLPRLSANLNGPLDVKGDSAGNIYIAESDNCIVRVVDSSGIVSVLFGTPSSCGFSSGISSHSSLIKRPVGIWVDNSAHIYFSDVTSIYRSLIMSSPTSQPSQQPTVEPTQPTSQPSTQPTRVPTGQPTVNPSQPSSIPSRQPVSSPSVQPTSAPSHQPSSQPDVQPTTQPTSQPTGQPISRPSSQPSSFPSIFPSVCPTAQPSTSQPSSRPAIMSTEQPIAVPSTRPSSFPSSRPSNQPTVIPSRQPSSRPSCQPTHFPSCAPTGRPTVQPTNRPTSTPSGQPSPRSTSNPTGVPSGQPTLPPTGQQRPSRGPTGTPSVQPTCRPSSQPTLQPSGRPTDIPSSNPSVQPTTNPTVAPSNQPSSFPTCDPSIVPSSQPSGRPSSQPFEQPSGSPTGLPTGNPSCQPTGRPSRQPSSSPSCLPSNIPSAKPTTGRPSSHPSAQPTRVPTSQPSSPPSSQPVKRPSSYPSSQPSTRPSKRPSSQPSRSPSSQPSKQPVSRPSSQPSRQPSSQPSLQPTSNPSSSRPTSSPSLASSAPTPVPAPSFSSSPSTTRKPTRSPTMKPTRRPTVTPTVVPSCIPTVVPTPSPTFAPTNALSVFPVGSNHFRGSLFLLGSAAGSSSDLDTRNIILNNVLPGQRSFILFGQKKNNRVIPNIQIGSRESHGYYSEVVVPPRGVGGLNRDDSSSSGSSSRSVTIVGDINNDGFDDLLLGFPTVSTCFGYLGSEKGFQNLIVYFSIYGATVGDEFGWSVAKAGDVNRDQYDDMIICAKGTGVCYVLYGRSVFNDHIYVQNMSSSDGFRIIGSASSTINFGVAVDYAGDFNKDGYSDLVISAMSFTSQGIVYVIFGRPVDQLKDDIRIKVEQEKNNNNNSSLVYSIITPSFSFAGLSIAGIGDMNNDGFDDIAIGSVPFRGGYQTQGTYVVFGRTATATNRTRRSSDYSLDVSAMIVGKDGFTITGGGFVVSGVGDLNEDGIADLMITSYYDWRGGVGGKSNGYLMNYPRNMSSAPTYFPSSSPSSFPSSSPSSLPTEAATTKTPSNHPSVITAPPVLAINESASPTVVSSLKPTRKTSNPTTIKPSRSPSFTPSSTISPTRKPTVLPTRIPSRAPFNNSVAPTRSVQPTASFRPSVNPIRVASAVPSFNQSVISLKGLSFTMLELSEPGEYIGSANTNEVFSLTSPGVYSIVSHPLSANSTNSTKTVSKVFSLTFVESQIIIVDGFQTSSDVIDLNNFPTIRSMDDISYTTNPLKIILPGMDGESDVPKSKVFSSADVFTTDTNHRNEQQQTITLTDFDSLISLGKQNFIFRPPNPSSVRMNEAYYSLQLLLSFGIVVLMTALVIFLKCISEDLNKEDESPENEKDDDDDEKAQLKQQNIHNDFDAQTEPIKDLVGQHELEEEEEDDERTPSSLSSGFKSDIKESLVPAISVTVGDHGDTIPNSAIEDEINSAEIEDLFSFAENDDNELVDCNIDDMFSFQDSQDI
jgi:sugar lactone lactonase YvrE